MKVIALARWLDHRHGLTSKLSRADIDDLVAYLESL
jgi:hypothetical protein